MKQFGFPRSLRVRRRQDFLNIQRNGQKQHLTNFIVFVLRNSSEEQNRPARMGVTVTRKVGNAVHRNRIKRWLREAFRHRQLRFQLGLDLVWIAKRQVQNLSFRRVELDMEGLLKRSKMSRSSPGKNNE